jgi:aminomethyltransferase
VGKAALARRREQPTQVLVGLEVEGGEPVAHGDSVVSGGETVGIVTSGAFSPGLDKNLALARVTTGQAALGGNLEVERADSAGALGATVVRVPFYDPDKTRPRS